MPHTYAQEELQERYEKLPATLKDAIFSTEVADNIFECGKQNGLTVEKVGFLAEETGRVILGLTRPNEFVAILAERLGTDADAARKIASDISHRVFFPLRELLRSTHQIDVGEGALQGLPPLTRPPAPPAQPASASPAPPVLRASPPSAIPAPLGITPLVPLPPLPTPPAQKAPAPPAPTLPQEIRQPTTIPKPPVFSFLSRDELEHTVAEKRIMPPLPPKPAETQKPPLKTQNQDRDPTPVLVRPIATPADPHASLAPPARGQPIDLRKAASVPPSPPYPQPLPPTSPQSSPQVSPVSKIPPIDLRKDKEITLDFRPPPPTIPHPKPQPVVVPPLTSPPSPTLHTSTPEPKPAAPPPPAPSTPLSPPTPKPPTPVKPPVSKSKPWSGNDPYREPIE